MKNKKTKSLSTKIVLSIAVVSMTVILVVFAAFEKLNQKAFYSIEIGKAQLIADTIEPLLAMDIYLELGSKIDRLALQLIENPNILLVRISKKNQVLYETKSPTYNATTHDSFTVFKDILQPNSNKKIGRLELVYSSQHYKELIDKYTRLVIYFLIGLGAVFLIFSLYVKELLLPLRKIALSLKNYSPDKEINIAFSDQNNEIGLISSALSEMQSKILDYAKRQQDINHILEEKVGEKTVELRKQLYTDTLTGLPNRISLIEEIRTVKEGALIIVNIDDFKEINDFFGHLVGDSILIKFAGRLRNIFKNAHTIKLSRLSGDEFALLYEEKLTQRDFKSLIKQLLHHTESMIFFHKENELGIRVTIGATLNMQAALEKADIALKYARKNNKSFTIYDENLNVEKQYQENMEWVKKLKYSIDKDKILPYYQPIFDNQTGRVASYECLMRMMDKNGDILTPFQFLDIAKKSRLYTKLTRIMIEKSCRHFEHTNCMFSINLSVDDILDAEMVEFLKNQLQKYNVAEKFIFEILESEGIENYEQISQFIDEMKLLGCKVAVDDFGSGYSNYEHLLQLNIDYIKIDGTLIKNLDKDENAQIVVETIVDFAKRLGIKTVAEFVHNEEIYQKVKELGIDRTQGFHLGIPQAHTKPTC